MRWNCPHCRVSLEASDDQISSGWKFSLCPKCSRFGLIRASSQGQHSAVKVDRAPAEEHFIRASTVDSTQATEITPIIRPAQLRSKQRQPEKTLTQSATPVSASASTSAPAPTAAQPQAIKAPVTAASTTATPVVATRKPAIQLPTPLPEVPEARSPIFPKLIVLGCLGMLAWNGYRYLAVSQDSETVKIRDMSDQVVAKAMAPIRIELGSQIQARSEKMQIRNGPGLQFPVIGELSLNERYAVLSIEEPWFQIQAGTKAPAWVMSDEISPAN